ncbi:MAG: threonine/serine exporter family protein [Thermaerobacter sp.]|nr:threonine/serine exporter family protein [Thermaerobacter sp.]
MTMSDRTPNLWSDPLTVVAEAGVLLLTSGAETSRVEDTMGRLADAFGVPAQTMVMPTALFLHQAGGSTVMQRVRRRGTNLAVVELVNAWSRDVAAGRLTLGDFAERLSGVSGYRRYPPVLEVAAAGVAAALLAVLFGAGWLNMPFALLAGAVAQGLRAVLRAHAVSPGVTDFVGAMLAALPALLDAGLGLGHGGAVLAGGLMVLVPGVMMTTGVRDGIAGDLLASVSRLLEAAVVAAAVAAGAALPLYLYLLGHGRWPV